LTTAATLQNRAGPQYLARYTVTSAQTQNLGRPLGLGTSATQLVAPGTLYGPRVTQLDFRLGKVFRMPRGRIQASMDIFNLLNSSGVLAVNTTYGGPTGAWLTPTQILQGRLIKLGAQLEF
jgi:hypothetical protein